MKILVTGATGFIGRNLVRKLSDDHEITCLVRPSSDISDIKNYARLVTSLDGVKVEVVIHLASCFLASHKYENIENLITSNVLFGTQLADKCKQMGVEHFINVGTYWQHFEGEAYNPVNLYAATKQAFEDILKFYTETTGLKVINLKLNDTFGPNDTRRKIFNLWKEISEKQENLEMSPGEQLIDIIYIDDVVNAFEKIISYLPKQSAGIENFKIGAERKYSLKELAEIFEEATGKVLNISWGARSYRNREVMKPKCPYPNVPNWKPRNNLADCIAKLFLPV